MGRRRKYRRTRPRWRCFCVPKKWDEDDFVIL
jgi:hypothetical protein